MSDHAQDATVSEHDTMDSEQLEQAKGKGKAQALDDPMEESGEDDSEEDDEAEGEGEVEEPDEDNMEEIDMDNIVGSRTRGKNIDYAQAAKDMEGQEDEEDEDDEDFEDPDDAMEE